MPYCPNCGEEVNKGDGFCPNCGNELTSSSSSASTSEKSTETETSGSSTGFFSREVRNYPIWKWISAGLILIIFGLLATGFLFSSNNQVQSDYAGTIEDNDYEETAASVGESCSTGSDCSTGNCVHGTCRYDSTYCGDGYCDQGESYSTCSADCQRTISGEASLEYSSCSIETEPTGGGITISQGSSIEDINEYDERGGISEIRVNITEGELERGDTIEIESEIYDSSGRVSESNSGSITYENIDRTENGFIVREDISLPYEENGRIELTVTLPTGKEVMATKYIDQASCLKKTVGGVFEDLMQCSDTGKESGEDCSCSQSGNGYSCVSHQTTDGGYSPNARGTITLVEDDRVTKEAIKDYVNKVGFSFNMNEFGNTPLTCSNGIISSSSQYEAYFQANYDSDRENPYTLYCSDSPY